MNPSMGSLQGVFSALKPGQLNKLGQLPRMLEDAQVGLKYFDDENVNILMKYQIFQIWLKWIYIPITFMQANHCAISR